MARRGHTPVSIALAPGPRPHYRALTEIHRPLAGRPARAADGVPHAVYTCSTELLQQAYALAEEFDLVFQIHLSETAAEVEQIREKFGLTPVRLLESLGCLSGRTLAAHCVHLDDEEIALLARTGVSVAHNAESNMKLASGIAPVPAMIAAGVNVTVGTDGCASNNNLDMISELSTVAKLHKVSTMDPTALDDCTALALATENAARALKFMGKDRAGQARRYHHARRPRPEPRADL